MKKSTYLFSVVLLFFFGLMACQQSASNNAAIAATTVAIDSSGQICLNCSDSLVTPPKRGEELPFALAKICFNEYDTVMSKYCFLRDANAVRHGNDPRNHPGTIRRRQVDSFRLVTRSESFLGTDMLCWLARKGMLAPDTSKIVTELRMGIYSDSFFVAAARANVHIPDSIRRQKRGRMTIFLVPYPKVDGKRGDPPVVYDFGSLQP